MNIFDTLLNTLFTTIKAVKKTSAWFKNKYSSQVNADLIPYTSCASHAGCWFLQNVASDYFDDYTPDDYTREINGKKYLDWTKKNINRRTAAKYKGNLNQLWRVQEKFINDKLSETYNNCKVVFNANTTIDDIRKAIYNSPVIVDIYPRYNGIKLEHVVLIVDYNIDNNEFVIDDSFGDFRCDYKTGNIGKGNDLKVSILEFEKIRGTWAIYVDWK